MGELKGVYTLSTQRKDRFVTYLFFGLLVRPFVKYAVLTAYTSCIDSLLMAPTKPKGGKGSDLVPLNLRMSADLINALDKIVAEREASDPFTPVTRTDIIREALVRTVAEWRSKKEQSP